MTVNPDQLQFTILKSGDTSTKLSPTSFANFKQRRTNVDAKTAGTPANQVFVISREYAVPRKMMFKVWTGPAHMQRRAPLNATEEERKTFEAGIDSMHNSWTGTLDQLAAYLAQL